MDRLIYIKKNGYTVFSCFSCGGGSSMGYKLAGYDVIGNCEIDPAIMRVYKANHHPKFSYLMDIRDFLKIPDEEIPEELKHLDILDGSPPCSVFSMAGSREDAWNIEKTFREGQAKQRLDDLFLFFIEIAKKSKPKVIVAENVKGLLLGNAKGWMNVILRAFDEAGYSVQVFLFNSSRMGVPQKRERVFFIAHQKELNFGKLRMAFDSKPIPFKDVRSEKGKPFKNENMASRLLKYRIKTDRDLSDINKRVKKGTSGFTATLVYDEEPSGTITANGELYRYYDGLAMTTEDIINCQTFPQDYNFLDQNVQYICGMSAPPVMMAKIAEQIWIQWLRKEEKE